jgi:hypothetical protein
LSLTLACFFASSILAQSRGHLQAGAPSKVIGKRGDAVQANIPVSIDAGFHVNSNKPSAEYLIPLSLAWTATGALEAGVIVYPKASTETVAGEKLSVFTGKFDLIANFKIAGSATAGPGSVAGKLKYQACNSNACFRPETIEISVPYQVQ